MREIGELALLAAFVGSGFSACAHLVPAWRNHRVLRGVGTMAATISVLALSAVMGILGWALYTKDFGFAYVAQYSSLNLPWYYSLSALWVGQAGSLLLWAWFSGVLAVLFYGIPAGQRDSLRSSAFGILMGYTCFLVLVMVFAADPMATSLVGAREGAGLSPLLQHPAMLIHPPVVFLGYSLWTIPFALALAAVITGRIDTNWVRQARVWALLAWVVLGGGILLGAEWSYEELGWGGYWAWDPVENGSLLPWLTGTVLIHGLLAWQYRRILKTSTLVLAFTTFGLCNFATFLTRSGVFSSLHAFSESPIGWLFLGLMVLVMGVGLTLLMKRREDLVPESRICSALSREGSVMIGGVTLVILAVVVLAGTLSGAASSLVSGRTVMVGPAFYNNVLIPTGVVLLLSTAMVPLLRWGDAPTSEQRRALLASAGAGLLAMVIGGVCGLRHPLALVVAGLAVSAIAALLGGLILESRRRVPERLVPGMLVVLQLQRRQYAGFLIHLGFVCLVLGITGSSLGKREQGFTMTEGQTIQWNGREIRLVRMHERPLADKIVAEAELEIAGLGNGTVTLRPAQHFHRLQEQWTTEVAIHATWKSDFYAILHSGDLEGTLYLTFVENPLMRWLWAGGGIMVLGAAVRLWPGRRRRRSGRATLPGELENRGNVRRRAAA